MSKGTSNHHRKPRSIGGTREARNVSRINSVLHDAWHRLFWNLGAYKICELINRDYLDKDYKFICVPADEEE